MNEHRRIILFGDVKKIDIPYYTQIFCIDHQLNGFVKNGKPDSLYIEAEGNKEDLEALEQYFRTAPLRIYLTDINVERDEVKGFSDFGLKVGSGDSIPSGSPIARMKELFSKFFK